jgi:hypothetical protein
MISQSHPLPWDTSTRYKHVSFAQQAMRKQIREDALQAPAFFFCTGRANRLTSSSSSSISCDLGSWCEPLMARSRCSVCLQKERRNITSQPLCCLAVQPGSKHAARLYKQAAQGQPASRQAGTHWMVKPHSAAISPYSGCLSSAAARAVRACCTRPMSLK